MGRYVARKGEVRFYRCRQDLLSGGCGYLPRPLLVLRPTYGSRTPRPLATVSFEYDVHRARNVLLLRESACTPEMVPLAIGDYLFSVLLLPSQSNHLVSRSALALLLCIRDI